MTAKVITDREIQIAAERVRKAGDEQIAVMLEQLLDFREHGRDAVAEHNFDRYYNGGISQMTPLVNQSGCQWAQCDRAARTSRVRPRGYVRLCRAHADEGETQWLWYEAHPNNVRLKQEDMDARAWEAKRAAEIAADQQRARSAEIAADLQLFEEP